MQGFYGSQKKHLSGICLGIVLFISSNQQYHKCNLLLVWDFFGYAKNVGFFLDRHILKLGFFGYKI